MGRRKTPLTRDYRRVSMHHRTLAAIALLHQEALEADQKSPKTRQSYAWGQQQTIRDLARLAGHEPTLADWLDPALQRRRYREIAERERSGQWRRATVCAQFRADSGWETFMIRDGVIAPEERITGRVITRPKDTSPQKTPVSVDILKQIPQHYDENQYAQLSDLVRIYTLVDTLVRADELLSIRIGEYDGRTGTLRITNPKDGGSRAVQQSL